MNAIGQMVMVIQGKPILPRRGKKRSLLPDQRRAIIRMYRAGATITEIAQKYGCARDTVYKVLEGVRHE